MYGERHNVRLAQRINRRIRDLRETLLAIIPKRPRKSREKRGRRVVAHAPVGFFAMRECGEKCFELIVGPSSSGGDAFCFAADKLRRGRRRSEMTYSSDRGAALVHCETLQNFSPAKKNTRGGIGENHFAGPEALALGDARFFEIQEARFGAGDQETIVRQRVAQRAESIAVELRADEFAIRENERGGPVPRF